MIISNMEEKDWEQYLNQPSISDDCVDVIQNELPLFAHEYKNDPEQGIAVKMGKHFREEKPSDNVYDYIRVIKSSAKAKFYATEIDTFHTHGFWCPNAAIEKDVDNRLTVASWCKITIIEWE